MGIPFFVFIYAYKCLKTFQKYYKLRPESCEKFKDELLWAAASLYRATKAPLYWDFIVHNIKNLEIHPIVTNIDGTPFVDGSFAEFIWDAKHAGIYVLVSKVKG